MRGCTRQKDKACTRCGKIYKCSVVVYDRALYCPACREIAKHEYDKKSHELNDNKEKHESDSMRSGFVIVKDLSDYGLMPGLKLTTEEMMFHLRHKWIKDDSIVKEETWLIKFLVWSLYKYENE